MHLFGICTSNCLILIILRTTKIELINAEPSVECLTGLTL